jgi:uncharacterized Tic20 family protein
LENNNSTDQTMNPTAVLHFASAFGAILPFGSIILPYIIHHVAREQWHEKKEELTSVKKQILVFQLPLSIASVLLLFLIPTYIEKLPLEMLANVFTLTVIPLLTSALGLVQFGVPLYAGVRVLSGHTYKYPTLIAMRK